MTDGVQQQPVKKEPSKALLKAINEVVGSFGRTRDKITLAFEIGRKEGFTDMEIGNVIRRELKKTGFAPHLTISKYFPETAKYWSRTKANSSASLVQAHARQEARKRNIIQQMRVDEYRSTELATYPKRFLIAIIKWYEAKEAELQKRQAEIQSLLTPINKKQIVSSGGVV